MNFANNFLQDYHQNTKQFLENISVRNEQETLPSPLLPLKTHSFFLQKGAPDLKKERVKPVLTIETLRKSTSDLYKVLYLNQKDLVPFIPDKKTAEDLFVIFAKVGADPFPPSLPKMPSKEKEDKKAAAANELYQTYLAKARAMNFPDLAEQRAIYLAGNDAEGRPVVAILAERLFKKENFQVRFAPIFFFPSFSCLRFVD